jgi:hypothetical protein
LTISIASSFLVACTANTSKTESQEGEVVGANTEQSVPTNTSPQQQSVAQPQIAPRNTNNQIAPPDALSKLQGQITALQEQVIKLSSDSAANLQINQLLLAKAQVQAVANDGKKGQKATSKQASNTGSNQQLRSVLSKLEAIAPEDSGAFGIVSSYTARKQWVLIRFDRQTGETWLADNSGWNALAEPSELPVSQYDVHLIRADQDSKGYVASRIDRRSGDTWWLNKNSWVVYQ